MSDATAVIDLRPGMVASDAVTDRVGRRLVGAGETLTERHIRVFRMCGVGAVRIVRAAAPAPEAGAAPGRFALADVGFPPMAVLHRLAGERAARRADDA